MKRAVMVIVGILLLLIGLGSAAIGTGIVVGAGSEGEFSTQAGNAAGDGYALVFTDFAVDTGGNSDTLSGVADLRVGANSTNGKRLFIGVGPSSQVNQYLSDVSYGVVSNIDSNGSTKVIPVPGTRIPTDPMDQTFWTVKAQGSSPRISIDPATTQTLVVMNSDVSQQVAIDLEVGVKSRFLFPAGIGLIVVGVIFVLLAIWAFVRSGKKKNKGLPPGSYPAAMSAGYPQPQQYPPNPASQQYQPQPWQQPPPATWQPPTQQPPPPAQPPQYPPAGGSVPPQPPQ